MCGCGVLVPLVFCFVLSWVPPVPPSVCGVGVLGASGVQSIRGVLNAAGVLGACGILASTQISITDMLDGI